jgi:hypothetical protein
MAKNKKTDKPGFSDLVTLAKSGWTPTQVNELLDRFDAMGDLNAPDPADEDDNEDDEDIETEDIDQDESDEDEDDNVSDEDSEDDDTDASDDTKDKKKDINKQHSLEVENTRLKKQIQKLQQKNRSKDISGGNNEKPIEKSLIDTFQSKFE